MEVFQYGEDQQYKDSRSWGKLTWETRKKDKGIRIKVENSWKSKYELSMKKDKTN